MKPASTSLVKPVTLFTRLVFILAALLAIIAGIQLYIFTDYTEHWFAWTIAAPLSAAFLGAGYWTGATLLLIGLTQRAWADVRVAIAAVAVFIPSMLLTTFLHLDRFHLTNAEPSALIAGWAWMLVYVFVPFPILALLVIQKLVPGNDPPRTKPVWIGFRLLIGANAALSLLIALVLFIFPEAMNGVWPWALTPLTARAIAGGFFSVAIASFQVIGENDWKRARVGTLSYLFIGLLQLLAIARFASTVEWGRPGTWLYILFMLGILAGGLYSTLVAWWPSPPQKLATAS
jgi:hypothetical protein